MIACFAFVVQSFIVFALFSLVRKMQNNTTGLVEKAEPVLAKVEPVLDMVGPLIAKIGPALDSINATAAKLGPAIDRFLPVVDRSVVVVERTGALILSANQLVASTNQIVQDSRPGLVNISEEAAAIVRSGREQVERVGELLQDAGDRARVRLEQIDHSVETTVDQIENVSGAMKSAVLRPVREVNGIAAGISAAVSTLVRGQKSSVDSATQDEEMFI